MIEIAQAGRMQARDSGPERELLKLLAHPAPEVRGLAAMLAGKLAGRIALDATVLAAVRRLEADENPRVRASAELGVAASARGAAKPAACGTRGALIPPHGGYETLESYKMAEIVFDGTVRFCDRFINIRSRTHDQMVQAARSGKQNIVEGSMASGTSKKTEIRLIGVARASLEELLKDYHDFLRNRNLPVWNKNDPRAQKIRKIAYDPNKTYGSYRPYVEDHPPEVAANAMVCAIHQTSYLLDRQLEALEAAFVEEGGFTERLYRVRSERRKQAGK